MSIPIHVTLYGTLRPNNPETDPWKPGKRPLHVATPTTWGEFVAWVQRKDPDQAQKAGPESVLFSLVQLRAGAERSNANVETVTGWVLDLDHLSQSAVDEVLRRLATDGLAFVAYTSHSHKAGAPRWRVVGPLAGPLPARRWPEVWRTFVNRYAPGADPQCKDASRCYYLPPPNASWIDMSDGAPLDVAALPAEPAAARRVDLNAPEIVKGRDGTYERAPAGTNPFTHADHLCRTMPPAVSGQGGHVALLRVARALRWGLDLPSAQCAKLIAEEYSPRCDPPWSQTEIDHKVEAAGHDDGAPFARGALLPPEAPDVLAHCAAQHRTDSGNAERFHARFGDRVRYCTPRKKWLLWAGQRWEWDERDHVLELAKETARGVWDEILGLEDDEKRRAVKHALYSESRQGLANMVALAQPKFAVLPAELDADPWLLNVSNGTLDLRTGELRAHAQDDLITKIVPLDFDPGATSALWDDCLAKFTGGDSEMAAYLRRAVGYALVGHVSEKAFWFAYGAPDGGKSTFLLAIAAALGDYHVSTDADTWLQRRDVGGNRGDIVRLLGGRLVTCVEIQKGARFDAKLLKSVTGGDTLTGAAKYESDISFLPSFAVWFAANDAPAIHEDDDGMWRRVRRVPFTHSIPLPEQDRTVQARIQEPEHARAVLAWAVLGCQEWQRGGLGTCAAIEASSAAYRREQDRLAGFFEDRCEFDPTEETSSRTLREVYEQWCQKQRARPIGTKEFAAKLRERGCESRKAHGVMVWGGVRLASG